MLLVKPDLTALTSLKVASVQSAFRKLALCRVAPVESVRSSVASSKLARRATTFRRLARVRLASRNSCFSPSASSSTASVRSELHSIVRVHSHSQFAHLLIQYQQHPEAKSLAPDGTPCAAETKGLPKRAHIRSRFDRKCKPFARRWEAHVYSARRQLASHLVAPDGFDHAAAFKVVT